MKLENLEEARTLSATINEIDDALNVLSEETCGRLENVTLEPFIIIQSTVSYINANLSTLNHEQRNFISRGVYQALLDGLQHCRKGVVGSLKELGVEE